MNSHILKTELRRYEDASVDIEDLLHNTYNLMCLARPVTCIIQSLDKIRRWEPWSLCLVLLCICNSTCIMLEGYFVLFSVTIVLSLAGLGYTHRNTNILAKVMPPFESDNEPIRVNSDDNIVNFSQEKDLAQSELVDEFRLLLCLMNEITGCLAQFLLQLYSIIKWEDLHTSLKCYTFLFVLTLLVHILPSQFILAIFIDIFLLHHPIYQYFLVMKGMHGATTIRQSRTMPHSIDESDHDAMADSPMNVDDEQDDSELHDTDENKMADCDNVEEGDIPVEEKSEAGSSSDDPGVVEIKVGASNTSLSSGGGSDTNIKNKRTGVVGKILKTVKNQTSSGSCEGCKVNFTVILKRRRLCSHCGNHFCARCCSYKVTRSMFGATAPAAQTETVSVCLYCFTYLNKILYSNKNGKSRVNGHDTNTSSVGGIHSAKEKNQ